MGCVLGQVELAQYEGVAQVAESSLADAPQAARSGLRTPGGRSSCPLRRTWSLPGRIVGCASGDDPRSAGPAGDDPSGDDPAGDDPRGDDPAGDDPRGDDPRGDDPAGDDPAGDDPALGRPAR